MAAPKDTWPLRTISQITIASEDKRINTRYEVAPIPQNVVFSAVQSKVSEYYKFSKYLNLRNIIFMLFECLEVNLTN